MFRIRSSASAMVAAIFVLAALLLPTLWSAKTTAGSTVLLGNTNVQPNHDSDLPGTAEALQYTAQQSGNVGALTLYLDSGSQATSVVVGLYSDRYGSPRYLLTKGTITHPVAGAWNTVSVNPAQVTAGHKYWLGLLGLGGQINYRDVAYGGPTQNTVQTNLTTLTSRWSTGPKWMNSPASFYASTTPGPVPATTPTPSPTSHSTPTPTSTPKPTPTSTPNPTSTPTPASTPTPTPVPTATPPASGTDCFAAPGKCGYPDPNYNNVGATTACSLPVTNQDITVSSNAQPLQNMNIHGSITVNAANVTITNVCVSENGEGNINNGDAVRFNAPGGKIEHSTIHGANATNQSVEIAIGGQGTASFDYLYNCGECVHDGPWTVSDSYVITNGDPYSGGYNGNSPIGEEDHFEDLYMSDSSATLIHDTLLNPQDQTAVLFGDNYGGQHTGAADNHWVITNNLIAGGGYTFYLNARGTSPGSSSISVTGNRFARCGTTSNMTNWEDQWGGYGCPGGANQYGYSPLPGYYGLNYGVGTYCTSQNWSGNIWDDNQTVVAC